MRGASASLLLVLVLAKVAALAGHHVPLSWWSPIAYLWQDAVVVLIFAAVEFCLGRRRRSRVGRVRRFSRVCGHQCSGRACALHAPDVAHVARRAWPSGRLDVVLRDLAKCPLFVRSWPWRLLAPLVFPTRCSSSRSCLRWPLRRARAFGVGACGHARPRAKRLDRAHRAASFPACSSRPSAGDWRAPSFDRAPYEDLSRFRGAAAGRNVVLVSLESTAAQYLGLYGAEPDVMPNLSELARTAIVFDNAYAVYPESIKGLFSILCSTYPAFDSRPELMRACLPVHGGDSVGQRIPHGAVPFGPLHVSGDGVGYPQPWLPDARRCGRHRRKPQLQLRRG